MVVAPTFNVIEFDLTSATSGTWLGFVDTSTRALSFGNMDNSVSGVLSSTKVVAMSGVRFNGNSVINNMKFYMVSNSDWTTGDYRFYMSISNSWVQNNALTTSYGLVPTSVPSSQNYRCLYGGAEITGSGQGDGVGQWTYLAAYAGTDVPDGVYGAIGGGGFRYRFTYDYF
jgi:hypothetical protein